MALSTAQIRSEWSDIRCVTRGSAAIDLGNARILAHPDNVEVWQAVEEICLRHRYTIRRADTGSYNCRKITSGSGYSLHSYPGVAVDINWNSNPYRGDNVLVTDMPSAMIRDLLALRTRDGAEVLRWGGHYTTVKDAMHFEIVCRRASLRTGIVDPNKTDLGEGEDEDMLSHGDRNERVKLLQHDLNRLIALTTARGYGGDTPAPDPILEGGGAKREDSGSHLVVDGVYGDKTAEFVVHCTRRMRWILGYPMYYDTGRWVDSGYQARLVLAIEKELKRAA